MSEETKDSDSGFQESVPGFEFVEGKKKGLKKQKPMEDPASLNLTSLMDAFTIILIFLLLNYGHQPIKVTPGKDMDIPVSLSMITPEETATVTITKKNILVNDKWVADLVEGKVDAASKRDGENGYFITPLFDALSAEAEKQKTIAKYNTAQSFKGMVTIVADKAVPYRLLTEILYTSGQAEFGKFKFAVIQKLHI